MAVKEVWFECVHALLIDGLLDEHHGQLWDKHSEDGVSHTVNTQQRISDLQSAKFRASSNVICSILWASVRCCEAKRRREGKDGTEEEVLHLQYTMRPVVAGSGIIHAPVTPTLLPINGRLQCGTKEGRRVAVHHSTKRGSEFNQARPQALPVDLR